MLYTMNVSIQIKSIYLCCDTEQNTQYEFEEKQITLTLFIRTAFCHVYIFTFTSCIFALINFFMSPFQTRSLFDQSKYCQFAIQSKLFLQMQNFFVLIKNKIWRYLILRENHIHRQQYKTEDGMYDSLRVDQGDRLT